MAFPTVQTADTQSGTVVSNSTSWTLTYPTNIAAGDLLLALMAVDGNPTTTWPAGWDGSDPTATATTIVYRAKVAVGTESGTFAVTISATEQGAWRVFRITGWLGNGILVGSGLDSAGMSQGGANGITANPDPVSLDPANWDIEDTLWIAAVAIDTSRTISVYPLADLNTADVSGGAGGATLGVCMMNDRVASKDPGTFTISASDDWISETLAIRPQFKQPIPRKPLNFVYRR